MFKLSAFCVILSLSVALSTPLALRAQTAPANQEGCPAGLTVGYRVISFGSVKTAVWYPSTSVENPYAYSARMSGSVALNAPPANCDAFPLVVFSHGYTGCGTVSAFITEQLARQGFIVAAPNHADAGCSIDGSPPTLPPPPQEPFSAPARWTDQTYIDRRNDIEAVIDGVLQSSVFGPITDATRIAGMGHSLGGYTILAMIGGWPKWRDARIQAALLMSPYCQPFLLQKTLAGIKVPVMYQGGTLDIGITPYVAGPGGAYDRTPPPKFFAELRAAGHFVWSNLACAQAGTVAACLDTVPNAWLIDGYGFAFFDYYVNQQPQPVLWGSGKGLADYRYSVPSATASDSTGR